MKVISMVAGIVILSGISTYCLAGDGIFFIGTDVGRANYHINSADDTPLNVFGNRLNKGEVGGALRFGYRWHGIVDYGLETGYVDLGQVSATYYPPYANKYQADLKERGWMLGGNLRYNISGNWYGLVHGGWFRAQVNNRGTEDLSPHCSPGVVCPLYGGSMQYKSFQSGNGEYVGVGGGFNFSSNFSLGLAYDYYHSNRLSNGTAINAGLYSLSAEYRF